MSGKRATKRRSVPREWCIPPAMLRDPGEGLEGVRILDETPGTLGILLWLTARDVTLWGLAPLQARESLFANGTADARLSLLASTPLDASVSASVDTLHGMLARPGGADAEIVSLCCLEMAAWARAAGLPHTAVAYAQAGAVAAPGFAEAALHVGICARAANQSARAETWLRRAIWSARRGHDGAAYAAALVELAELYEARGVNERAEQYYRWAYRAARRFSARRARMRAAHRLFLMALQRNDAAMAAQFGLEAQRACDPGAPGAPALLLTLARYWISLGELDRVSMALRRLVSVWLRLPAEVQLTAAALLARTRAALANPASGRGPRRIAWSLLRSELTGDEARFTAAMDLLHAARIVGDRSEFNRAKDAVLRYAPQADYPAVAAEVERMWPRGKPAPVPAAALERAS